MRQDQIETAIKNLPWERFEDFANEILRQSEFPGLIPTSRSHDLGQDAKTTWLTYFLNNDQWVFVATSKTSTLSKLRSDCEKNRHQKIDVCVFAVPEEILEDTKKTWGQNIKDEFGWDLEVRDIRYFAPTAANRPQFDRLVFDFLHIPPPDGDFPETILSEFQNCTKRALRNVNVHIPGIANSINRREVERIEEQFSLGKAVLLTGGAGVGKTGIGYLLAERVYQRNKVVVFLDARKVGHINDENGLRQFYSLKGSVKSAISYIGRWKGCTVIIDQLDNVIGLNASMILVDFAIDCLEQEGVEILVISRKKESHEVKLLDKLIKKGYIELNCFDIDMETTVDLLKELGIANPSDDLIQLGQNLLNLEMIANIHARSPNFSLNSLTHEIDLWIKFLEILEERESGSQDPLEAESLIHTAVKLARDGLNTDGRNFIVERPHSRALKRLISWGIILSEEQGSNWFRFKHEKLQDFLYSKDAVERRLMPLQIINEIKDYRIRNIIAWMDQLYARTGSTYYRQFTRELLLGSK